MLGLVVAAALLIQCADMFAEVPGLLPSEWYPVVLRDVS
jgi:hypothetical protein